MAKKAAAARTVKAVCPNCEHQAETKVIRQWKKIEFRKSTYRVEEEFLRCEKCAHEFDSFELLDPLVAVYALYREEKGMVRPDQIKALRKEYGLKQKELAAILKFGAVTLSRYENDSLQDEAHDTLLRLAMSPEGLAVLLKQVQPGTLPAERIVELERLVASKMQLAATTARIVALAEDTINWGLMERIVPALYMAGGFSAFHLGVGVRATQCHSPPGALPQDSPCFTKA